MSNISTTFYFILKLTEPTVYPAVLWKLKALSFDRSGLSLEDHEQGATKHREQLEDGIFGVLYTLTKEQQNKKIWITVLKSIVSFLQLLAFIISPMYNWDIDFEQPFLRFLSTIGQIQNLASSQGMSRAALFFNVLRKHVILWMHVLTVQVYSHTNLYTHYITSYTSSNAFAPWCKGLLCLPCDNLKKRQAASISRAVNFELCCAYTERNRLFQQMFVCWSGLWGSKFV